MSDDPEIRRRRAAYRASHRGTKEMDVVLGRYAMACLPEMSPDELAHFERFIAQPDPLITAWFEHRGEPEEAAFARIVGALRAFHGLRKEPSERSGV